MDNIFNIDPVYLTDVTVRTDYKPTRPVGQSTADDIVRALKGLDQCYSISSRDHPEFAILRDQLEAQGFIQTQRQWWNGDRVLQPFILNGMTFEIGEQFPCAVAMKGHLQAKQRYQ